MYVRWRRKQRADLDKLGQLLCAELVECRRVKGEPRQRIIAYLGGIREGCIEIVLGRHVRFWQDVAQRLDFLDDDLTTEERERIETALAKRVRRVTNAEGAELDEMLARLMATTCA